MDESVHIVFKHILILSFLPSVITDNYF